MSIKETITKELLDRIDDPAGLEEVLKRHGRSKGPLYSALAEATAQLRRQYESLVQETQRLAARQAQAESEISVLEGRQRSLGLKARGMEKDIGQKEARLSEVRGLIETADRLEGQGFGKDNLEQLFNLLAETAASQGDTPKDGVTKFFEVVDQVGGIVSLELQSQQSQVRAEKARAQAERWEAEAKRQEAKTKARATSINIVEQILQAGVKATDIPAWQKIINNAGISPDMLAANLEELGNSERLIKIRQKQANDLKREETKLAVQVRTLTKKYDSLHTAIEAVQIAGVNNIKQVGEEVVLCIQRSGKEARELFSSVTDLMTLKAQLEDETTVLRGEIQVARAIKECSPQSWLAVPEEVVGILILGMLAWAKGQSKDVEVPIPESIARARLLPRNTRLSLSQILLWAFTGFATPEQRKALGGGR